MLHHPTSSPLHGREKLLPALTSPKLCSLGLAFLPGRETLHSPTNYCLVARNDRNHTVGKPVNPLANSCGQNQHDQWRTERHCGPPEVRPWNGHSVTSFYSISFPHLIMRSDQTNEKQSMLVVFFKGRENIFCESVIVIKDKGRLWNCFWLKQTRETWQLETNTWPQTGSHPRGNNRGHYWVNCQHGNTDGKLNKLNQC
jgi:hypothetical protein